MRLLAVEPTELFIGPESAPLQVVRVVVDGVEGVAGQAGPVCVHVTGRGLDTPAPVTVRAGGRTTVEVGVATGSHRPGSTVPARVVARAGDEEDSLDCDLVVAEPGWTMHMVSHFHYDPVWWNTQGAYTSDWDRLDFPASGRARHQMAGFDLVRAHLDLALREPEYRFVLAEVDYLKPYWDTHPADRAVLRRLLAEGRLEIMGGTYNEPNTNLTSPESTIRNFAHGTGFHRHVLGADPETAWQLDVFGHDPAFPGMAADAGLSNSSWARGPFHQWGPMELRDGVKGDPTRMQFRSEFEWLSPSGRGVLTHYMADHYSAGYWMDSSPTLEAAEEATYELFKGLRKVATTRHVLLPVGTDYSPPNKWVTRIHRDWNSRYTWPRFVCSLPRDFFAAVRAELAERGVAPAPQTRDMNPIYTGKDVSYIDTKQAQRATEDALLQAERFAVFAALLTGARYPDAAFAKAWAQLVYGAHHDGITGSESDQVYIDLVTGWREARDLAVGARDAALARLSSIVDTGPRAGTPVVVWNPLTRDRADLVTVRLGGRPPGGVMVVDGVGRELPCLVEHDGASVTFLAEDVPSLGWRTFRVLPSTSDHQGWSEVEGTEIRNEHYRLTVDPARGGGVCSLVELATGRELIATGRLGNELAVYQEYPAHPRFGEGPWHLLPRGPVTTSGSRPASSVRALRCAVGERVEVRGEVGPVRFTQRITLWRGVRRVECSTVVEEFTGSDELLRVRWPCPVPGGSPVSEVGDAVIGRGVGFPDVDTATHPWTLDNPAYTWFGLGSTARVRVNGAVRSLGVAEVVVPHRDEAAPLARDLVCALARSGVTATTGEAGGSRYGNLDVDSNLPDFRIALGGPARNAFTAEVIGRAGLAWHAELDRQLAETGRAVLWVPAEHALCAVWAPGADLTDARALPVLVVAARDEADLPAVVADLAADLDDHEIVVEQRGPVEEHGMEERTVALLNRGMPGFVVDAHGTLHASLLRSCTGWPSGIWIDPPKRTTPDGSGFQLQHWTHVFEYALVSGEGDWRDVDVPGASAAYAQPLLAVPVLDQDRAGEPARLADHGSLLRVEPADRVWLGALKAAGNPLTRCSAEPADPSTSVAVRLVETRGEPTTATVTSSVLRLADAARADLLEHPGIPLRANDGLTAELSGYEIATFVAKPVPTTGLLGEAGDRDHGRLLAPEAEDAQPLYARYWLHNRGPAPLGGLPASVHVEPTRAEVAPRGTVTMAVSVASDRTDGDLRGTVRIVTPPHWAAEPAEFDVTLPPGGHVTADVLVHAPPSGHGEPVPRPGWHPVRARLALVGDDLPPSWSQVVEDVAVVGVAEWEPGVFGLEGMVDEADPVYGRLLRLVGGPEPVRVAAGGRGRLAVVVGTDAHAPIAVEARLVSPWGTWEATPTAALGVEVPARGEVEIAFDVAPPRWADPGTWWALVKVAGAGRLLYSPAVPVEVTR
ncbi:Glycosyl hydrolases family 38 C-terminal domain-containing protein [Streptoalloteichus tenebrarius]|uniref:Glycosyl hydrolases family 38 C-terminal domain-containing protein n=2 Tax=Streptoalloteichus tenebrarius (strain ATCC 17920 / DSM 40477 / JCM 4838 / CBS 697.72 / NBRC 16177 / NCIMB 11028 / NRRL B-12390 / A12253. 1 / ISP 5477) TaxID=1933 RepID=A0ABT1I2A7_STRSD|nr:Glycosyl hydrolases family 38 C-terminal domain-containing protein [Streptoalloteichus tenebrarius]